MKTFKLTLLSLIGLFVVSQSNAQIIYQDLNPDEVLPIPQESYNSMMLDLDGDNIDDVKFQSTNYPSFGIWNIGITQVDTNNPKIEILYNNSMPPSQIGDYYVRQLSMNDDISASSPYSGDYPQVGDIYYANFLGEGSKYIGFRLKSGADYKYGWLAVELSGSGNMTFTVMEYAYQNTVNTAIKAGQSTGVGIEYVVKSPQIKLYPNPAANVVNVDGNVSDRVRVYDIQGQLRGQWEHPELPLKIETSTWDQGVYIIEMMTAGKILRERLVKN